MTFVLFAAFVQKTFSMFLLLFSFTGFRWNLMHGSETPFSWSCSQMPWKHEGLHSGINFQYRPKYILNAYCYWDKNYWFLVASFPLSIEINLKNNFTWSILLSCSLVNFTILLFNSKWVSIYLTSHIQFIACEKHLSAWLHIDINNWYTLLFFCDRSYCLQLRMNMHDRWIHTFNRMLSMNLDAYFFQSQRSVFCMKHLLLVLFCNSIIWFELSHAEFCLCHVVIQTVEKGRSLLLQAKVEYLHAYY